MAVHLLVRILQDAPTINALVQIVPTAAVISTRCRVIVPPPSHPNFNIYRPYGHKRKCQIMRPRHIPAGLVLPMTSRPTPTHLRLLVLYVANLLLARRGYLS